MVKVTGVYRRVNIMEVMAAIAMTTVDTTTAPAPEPEKTATTTS
jgi:hypothetical protein